MSEQGASLPSWAKVGAKVVCIERFDNRPDEPVYDLPQVGKTYTIREVEAGKWSGWYFRLREISNPPHISDGLEPSFYYARFRPVVDDQAQERDVARFRHHLTQKIPEDAL